MTWEKDPKRRVTATGTSRAVIGSMVCGYQPFTSLGHPTRIFQDGRKLGNGRNLLNKPLYVTGSKLPLPKPRQEVADTGNREMALQSDPWASYFQNKKGNTEGAIVPKTSNASPPVIRAPDGPIEDRFKKQDAQIETLKNSVQLMSQQLDKQNHEQKDFQKQVAADFQEIKTDFSKQLEKSTQSFEHSLHHSLRRQDEQLRSAIGDLKAFIQQTPIPQKKAKVTKPGEGEQDD